MGVFSSNYPSGGTIMARRSVSFVKTAVLIAAAFLLMASPGLAGEHVRAGTRTTPPSQPAPAPVAHAAQVGVTISFAVTAPGQPATEPVYVDLRGPDGQVRRFPVEGGREAIQYRQVVLRPGQSVTIQWVAAK
jgi:hypothetical protein